MPPLASAGSDPQRWHAELPGCAERRLEDIGAAHMWSWGRRRHDSRSRLAWPAKSGVLAAGTALAGPISGRLADIGMADLGLGAALGTGWGAANLRRPQLGLGNIGNANVGFGNIGHGNVGLPIPGLGAALGITAISGVGQCEDAFQQPGQHGCGQHRVRQHRHNAWHKGVRLTGDNQTGIGGELRSTRQHSAAFTATSGSSTPGPETLKFIQLGQLQHRHR